MSQNLWYFRYFIYYLIKENVISKKEINSYCMSQKYGSNQKGYKSDLNWNYINSKDNVDEFFSELLEEKVPLIDLNYVNIINYIKPTFVLFKYTLITQNKLFVTLLDI